MAAEVVADVVQASPAAGVAVPVAVGVVVVAVGVATLAVAVGVAGVGVFVGVIVAVVEGAGVLVLGGLPPESGIAPWA